MSQTTEIQTYNQDLQSFKKLAEVAMQSGNYSNMTLATMVNIMMSAKDLGISPYKALNGGFYVVNGKIAMSTALMTDRIRKDGHSVTIPEWTTDSCTVVGKRKDNGDSVSITFTMEDAQRAGLTGSVPWKKYPQAMLYNRAMSMVARVLFPDVVGNCYSEDEGEEIAKHSFGKPTPSRQLEMPAPADITVAEMKKELLKIVKLTPLKHVEEYLVFCSTKFNKTRSETLESWKEKGDEIKKSYQKWLTRHGLLPKEEDSAYEVLLESTS